jgi:hypothetical protein
MDLILLLTALIIVIAITVYFSSSHYKFGRVRKYLDRGDRIKADALLLKLKDKHYEAALLHLSLESEAAALLQGPAQRNTAYKKVLSSIGFKGTPADQRLEEEKEKVVALVTDLDVQLIDTAVRAKNLPLAVTYFTSARQHARTFGTEEREKVIVLAAENGKKAERRGDLNQAAAAYATGVELAKEDGMPTHHQHIFFEVRTGIIALKKGTLPTVKRIRELAAQKTPESVEAAYRFALLAARQGKTTASAKIIAEFLADEQHPSLPQLTSYNRNAPGLDANAVARKLNHVIKSDDPAELSAALESLQEYERKITQVRPDEKRKIDKLPSFLFSRTIALHFEAGAFPEALQLISSKNDFFTETELLKNAGIACLNIVKQEQLDKQNYQLVIAVWLAAIYNDKVLVDSLESTSWDDDYSFTLTGNLGGAQPADLQLPENVNFQVPSRENISIGEVQRILLEEFEKNIHSLPESKLNHSIQQFYSEQQTALAGIIRHTGYLKAYGCPYFVERFGGSKALVQKLSHTFSGKDNAEQETMYELALPYVNKEFPEAFRNYAQATTIFTKMATAIQVKGRLPTAKRKQLRELLSAFPHLAVEYEDKITVLLALMADTTKSSEMAKLYEEARFVFFDSEILKNQHLESILKDTIERVNNDTMSNGEALNQLVEATQISSSNLRLLKNIGTLAKMNCVDSLNNELTSTGLRALKNLEAINKGLIREHVSAAVAPVLLSLIEVITKNDRSSANMLLRAAGITRPGSSPMDILLNMPNFGSSLNEQGEKMAQKLRFINKFANI